MICVDLKNIGTTAWSISWTTKNEIVEAARHVFWRTGPVTPQVRARHRLFQEVRWVSDNTEVSLNNETSVSGNGRHEAAIITQAGCLNKMLYLFCGSEARLRFVCPPSGLPDDRDPPVSASLHSS